MTSNQKGKPTAVAGRVTTTLTPSSAKPTIGYPCPDLITEIASHDSRMARVDLALGKGSLQTLELPVGTYSYNANRGDRICKLKVKVVGKFTQCPAIWGARICTIGKPYYLTWKSVVFKVMDSD